MELSKDIEVIELDYCICGHPSQQGKCSELCDDFVVREEGMCYLLAFEQDHRYEAFFELGLFPFCMTFSFYYGACDMARSVCVTPPTHPGANMHVQRESIPGQDHTVMHVGECTDCTFTYCGYSNSLRPSMVKDCPNANCGHYNTYKESSLIRFSMFANRLGSKISVRNLILKESTATRFELRSHHTYLSDSVLPSVETNVLFDGEKVHLTIGDDNVSYDRYEQKLKGFVHDYVSSCWKDMTDMKLSVLGVEGPSALLSPDFIIPETKCVLEVATCGTDNQKVLESSYEDKIKKYHGELERVGAKYFILVVSPQKVMTNLEIEKSMVDELTRRMRLVLPLKQKMIEILGEDVADDEYNETERLVKAMFKGPFECPELDDKYKYDRRELKEFANPPSGLEAISAARILLKTYEGTKLIHNASKSDLENYLNKFTSENTRCDMKRISNLPLLLPGHKEDRIDGCLEGNDVLKKMWCGAVTKEQDVPIETPLELVEDDREMTMKHITKRQMLTKIHLTNSDKEAAALSGIGGKAFKDTEEVAQHRMLSKLSFHPLVNTDDIDDFVSQNLLHKDGLPNPYLSYLLETAVEKSKLISCSSGDNRSVELWKEIMRTDFMKYSMMMTHLFMEMAYSYKHWTHHYEFMLKDMGQGVYALIYNPKSSIYVSFAFPRHGSKIWDSGRLGPELYYSSTHIFTDWSSFDNSQLEHFVKFGPYMGSCLVELMNSSESSATEFSKYCRDCVPHLLMLYCNNKTDVEELITSQRYLFMKLLEDVGKSPYVFVDRLPKVLRSRLTAYYLKKTLVLMEYYDTSSITKVPKQGEDMILYDYMNIKSLFSDCFITLNMKINEFYFGYVVSKHRNSSNDKTFKVLTKLIKQEQKFRKNVKGSIFTKGEEYEEFKSNMPLLKFFASAFGEILEEKFGKDYRTKILNDYVHTIARTNFSDLATLKVSSRDHSKDVEVPLGGESTEEIFNQMKKDFPEEILKRPFCMESMTQIIKEYEADTSSKIIHLSQLAPWCLKQLLDKGHFDSDQFDKDQHGGEREIHVLEFKARIVQFFLETVSRTICSYFPSETTVNPETKDRFVKDHYAKSKEMFGTNFTTISKSADATTWCQFHHSSHFAAMFQAILPEELKDFTLAALSLWPRKRLSFPVRQASSLAANLKLQTDNDVYMQFKSEFEKGEGMFLKVRSNVIEVISGMFQGILHTTSSLYHTMIQEVMKRVILSACKGRMRMDKVLITICQGSDDSGCMISVPGKPSLRIMKMLKRLLLWKERVTPYLSVFCNEAKSSIGTHDLIEYNSEWHVRHMIIKPTFRWVSASQQLSVTERFIDRFRMYNNMITDCLTGGASTLECSVIQLFQATMHYILMGLHSRRNESLKYRYLELLFKNPDPLHGFFPMDEDICCGITGVEYQLYQLYNTTNFGTNLRVLGDSELSMDYSPEDLPNWMKTKDMSSVRLKFSKMSVFYRVVERMNLEPLDDAVKAVENDPMILFSRSNSWEDEQHNLVLKVFSKGVRESISNKSSMLRMAASSAYILTNKCFSVAGETETVNEEFKDKDNVIQSRKVPVKHTLIHVMKLHDLALQGRYKTEKDKRALFPFHEEYDRIRSDILNLKKNSSVIEQHVKRTSKVKICVIPKPVTDVDVIDMCKRQWFDRGVHSLSQGQFRRKWADLVKKLPFLSSTKGPQGVVDTANNLKLNVVQTKMFLESLSVRSRSVVLYDSASRSGSLSYSLSRIYWPNSKLVLPVSTVEDKITELRSRLFSLMTFWYEQNMLNETCKTLIKNEITLNKSYSMIPQHGLRLKIISDVLKNVNNHDLVHRIEASRKGLLGSFVQQQKGKGKSRKGLGIWQGTICGIGTRIFMQDRTCTHIIVNSLYDTVTLGWHMNQFMNESSLEMPKTLDKKMEKTNCWLTSDGRILVTREPRGIPIYQDSSMKVIGTEDTANMQWLVDINNNNIRIRARDPTSNNLFTILSDTITNRDWIPGLSLDLDDPVFNKWSRGESLHMPSFERMMENNFPTSRYDFMKCKDDFENHKMVSKEGWDFKKMQKVLRDSIIHRGYLPDQATKLLEEDVKVHNNDIMLRFNSMLDTIVDEFEEDLEKEIAEWAEEVDMEEEFNNDMWGIDLSKEEEEELLANVNLFSNTSTDQYYELVDKADLQKNYSMPAAIRFFSPLEHLNMVINQESLRSSIMNARNSPGILGIVYTIAIGKYSVGRDDGLTSEIVDIEDEISNISSAISRPGALLTLTLDEIRIHIANLQHQIETSPKAVVRRLNRLLTLYKDREEEIIAKIDPSAHDLIVLNADLILQQLVNYFSENEMLPLDIKHLDDQLKLNIFSTIVKTETLSSNLLSPEEKEEVNLFLSTGSMSRSVLQSIGVVYDITLTLNNENVHTISGSKYKLNLSI